MKILRSVVSEKNESFKKLGYVSFSTSRELEKIPHKKSVRVVGLRSIMQKPPTAKGMTFITLEDEFGFMNLVIPPQVYQKERMLLYSSSFFHACGTLEHNGPVRNIKVEKIFPFLQETPDIQKQLHERSMY